MKSTNGGATWIEITTGLPTGSAIQSIRFSPTDPNKIYVCLASYSGNSLYCSVNGGTTWASISTGLPALPANCLAFQNNGDIFCGTDLGVYTRSASATTWSPYTNGMPGVAITALNIFAPTAKLRASTYGRGLWESPLTDVNVPPSVVITSPTNNASFGAPAIISIAANAVDSDGTISKIDFYNGTALIGTSTAAPFGYNWSNVAAGNYTITAKATDNSGNMSISAPVNVKVNIQNDAGVTTVLAPIGSINTSAVTPLLSLKNFGLNTVTSAQILYKIDNNINSSYNWSGSLLAGATVNISLPALTGYDLGTHTFTASVGTVNGTIDVNTTNNGSTFSFTYSNCSNDNETANNSPTTAPILALNTPRNSQIGSATDVDYYKFTTTTASPKIKISLAGLPADYDVRLYSAKTNGTINVQVAASQQVGLKDEVIVYNTPTVGATYYVKIEGYKNAFSTVACYSLLVQTSNSTFAKKQSIELTDKIETKDLIHIEPMTIYPNPAHDVVNVRFLCEDNMDCVLSLINSMGQTVKVINQKYVKGENFTTIATDDVPQGVYFVKMDAGKNAELKKVVIQ